MNEQRKMVYLLAAEPVQAPVAKRKRRGDSYGVGVRTVQKGRVRWNGKSYRPISLAPEDPYDGRYDGKRILFKQRWSGPDGMWLQLHSFYDEAQPMYFPYPKWVNDDVFDD